MPAGSKRHKAEAAIAALLTEPTIEQAAAKAGVSYRTLKGWLRQPAFSRAFRRARQQLLESTLTQMIAGASEAVAALRRNLTCEQPGAEIKAAVALLDQIAKHNELANLAAELEELRAELKRGKHNDTGSRAAHGREDEGRGTKGEAGGPSGVGADSSESHGDHDGSGLGAGSVASDPAIVPIFPNLNVVQ